MTTRRAKSHPRAKLAEPTAATAPQDTGNHPSTVGHGHSAPDACSVQWDSDATSAYGTAATAGFFVVIEQPGPWGRLAATESNLGAELGAELDDRARLSGGRLMLIRRPGGHPDQAGPRRVLVAHAGGADIAPWLLAADLERPGDLLGLDWSALSRGRRELVRASLHGAVDAEPQLLVCTNGRRDVCCAVRGRPIAVAAARLAPDRVWEVSHTGGHRFAPTGVLLPWGQTFARLDESAADWVLGASVTGHVPVELLGPIHDRGRSSLAPPAQCAESHVRAAIGETRLAALTTTAPTPAADADGAHEVVVSHADGRAWQVRVVRRAAGRRRPESCGKAAIDILEYVAEASQLPAAR